MITLIIRDDHSATGTLCLSDRGVGARRRMRGVSVVGERHFVRVWVRSSVLTLGASFKQSSHVLKFKKKIKRVSSKPKMGEIWKKGCFSQVLSVSRSCVRIGVDLLRHACQHHGY